MLFLILYAGYFVHFYPVLSVSGCVKKMCLNIRAWNNLEFNLSCIKINFNFLDIVMLFRCDIIW